MTGYLTEMHCGEGSVTKAASQLGLRGRERNVGKGARHDLDQKLSLQVLSHDVQAGCLRAVLISPPSLDVNTLRALRQILQLLRLHRVPIILQTAAASPLCLVPDFAHLIQSCTTCVAQLDSCVCGTRWRRTSRLLCGSCDPDGCTALDSFQGAGKLCAYSRPQRVQLTGLTTKKVIVAQTKSTAVARKLATVLVAAALGQL